MTKLSIALILVNTNVCTEVQMMFEWDDHKNNINIQKHGIDFNDVIDIFNHPMLTMEDTRESYNEVRWVSIGWLRSVMAVVVYTEQVGVTIRIISARKATRREVRLYEQSLKN